LSAAYLALESAILVMQSVFDTLWFRRMLRWVGGKALGTSHEDLLEVLFGISGETRIASVSLLFLNILVRIYAAAGVMCSGAMVRYGPNAAFWLKTKNAYAVLSYADYEKNIIYLAVCLVIAITHGIVARYVFKRVYKVDAYLEGVKLLRRHPALFAFAVFATVTWGY